MEGINEQRTYAQSIANLTDNIRDLMKPFMNRAYYSWEMMGSYSIRAVLPVLVPELTYDSLEIHDGGMAMDAYWQMCAAKDNDEAERIRKALLEYCYLDTLAMVRIVDKLQSLV
ncbi:MAG: hypothetical protein HQK96_13710 [Nitrospirae bacterium]|nr:hypothetical protein [Nitrospirota bacterium]